MNFFASAFTKEGQSELPSFEDKVRIADSLSDIIITPETVLKYLKVLKTSKACGPDNFHPYFLRECSDELCKPLASIF